MPTLRRVVGVIQSPIAVLSETLTLATLAANATAFRDVLALASTCFASFEKTFGGFAPTTNAVLFVLDEVLDEVFIFSTIPQIAS